MILKTEKFKTYSRKFQKRLRDLQENYYEFSEFIKSLSTCWNDAYTISFLEAFDNENKAASALFEELKKMTTSFDLVVSSYEDYGKNITLDEDSIQDLDDNILTLKNDLSDIEEKYNSLTGYDDEELQEMTKDNHEKINSSFKSIEAEKNKLVKICNDILDKEELISHSLNKINIPIITSIDFENLAKVDSNNVIKGFGDGFSKQLKKITYNIKDESDMFDDLEDELDKISDVYVSKSSDKLDELIDNIKVDFKVLHTNHINGMTFLDNRYNDFTTAAEEMKRSTDEITGGVR